MCLYARRVFGVETDVLYSKTRQNGVFGVWVRCPKKEEKEEVVVEYVHLCPAPPHRQVESRYVGREGRCETGCVCVRLKRD